MRRLLLGFACAGLVIGLVERAFGAGEATLPLGSAALLAVLLVSRTHGASDSRSD